MIFTKLIWELMTFKISLVFRMVENSELGSSRTGFKNRSLVRDLCNQNLVGMEDYSLMNTLLKFS